MLCDICGKQFTGGYALYGNFNICDECGRTYSLKQIDDILNSDKKTESATQPSMVSGGKVDVFTNNGYNSKLNNDWYSQLFELNDI